MHATQRCSLMPCSRTRNRLVGATSFRRRNPRAIIMRRQQRCRGGRAAQVGGMVCLVRACAVLGMGLGNSTCVSSRCEMVCVAAWCAWLHRHGHGYTVTTCGREWSHGEACGVAAVEVRAHMDMDYGSFLVGGGAEGQQGKGESESLGARCTSRADSVRSSPAWAST